MNRLTLFWLYSDWKPSWDFPTFEFKLKYLSVSETKTFDPWHCFHLTIRSPSRSLYPKKLPKFSSHYKFGESHACIFIIFGSWQIENLDLLDLALPSKFQDFFSIWTYFILDLGPTGLTGHIYSYDKVPFLLWEKFDFTTSIRPKSRTFQKIWSELYIFCLDFMYENVYKILIWLLVSKFILASRFPQKRQVSRLDLDLYYSSHFCT